MATSTTPGGRLLLPLEHPTTSLEAAVQGGTLGVGYAGAGLLAVYFIGVSKVLQQLGIIKPGEVKTAGTSSGALVQIADHPGIVQHDELLEEFVKLAARCRSERNCFGTLDRRAREAIESTLPANASRILSGNACTALTRQGGEQREGDYVCSYSNRQEVVDALRAACFITGWSSSAPSVPFQGKPTVDGGFTQLLPCPPNVTYCIKVSVIPPYDPMRSVQAVENGTEAMYSVKLVTNFFLQYLGSDPTQTILSLFQNAKATAAEVWEWTKVIMQYAWPTYKIDIYPGKYSKSPLTPVQWVTHLVVPPSEPMLRMLYRTGQSDARAWAKEQGWKAALL